MISFEIGTKNRNLFCLWKHKNTKKKPDKNLFVTHREGNFSDSSIFSRTIFVSKWRPFEMLREFLSVLVALSVANESASALNKTSNLRLKRANEVCGVTSQSTSLIINGNDFQRGTWPWMVALMQKTTSPPKLFCGGVLVSRTKVLTGENQPTGKKST